MLVPDTVPAEFHQMFAAWVRLEPRSRTSEFSEGVAARTADPLWMLARQWQVGELKADDAGSPIRVELAYETQAVDYADLGTDDAVALGWVPLETLIEREPFVMDWRMRVRIGQQFERLIRSALPARAVDLIKLYRDRHGLTEPPPEQRVEIDQATQRFIRLMADRVIDGRKLIDARQGGTLVELPPEWTDVSDGDIDNLFNALDEWRRQLYSEPADEAPNGTWRSNRLAYRFGLNPPVIGTADDPTYLVADDYRNGELDWYTLSAASDQRGEWMEAETITDAVPTRITIGGPSLRWWAFEDAQTDFGDLDAATPDLSKLLLMEFALIYGDDWFSVPVPAGLSQLIKITDLKVFNVFGEDTDVNPARQTPADPLQRWEMFTLSHAGRPREPGFDDCLFVPPVSNYREESLPLEEVQFLRDEGANMIWGVEHILPDGLGKPVRGFEAQRERLERQRAFEIQQLKDKIEQAKADLGVGGLSDEDRPDKEAKLADWEQELARLQRPRMAPSQDAELTYRLATTVPENWIPFVPAQVEIAEIPPRDPPRKISRLLRSQMLRNTDDEDPTPIPALSRLLGTWEDPLLWLDEYAVSRAGVRVMLTKQRVRDAEGRTFVWLGKKVLTGRGEGSSGLRFDIIS